MDFVDRLGEFGGVLLGFLLTILVFSFVYKDNPLYRLAVHILVGVSAGYAAVVAIREVFVPVLRRIVTDPTDLANLTWLLPLLLAILLVLKAVPRLAWMGNVSMGAIIGVGSAVALVGAIVGTLVPQTISAYGGGFLTLVVAVLSACALFYFLFTGYRSVDNWVFSGSWQRYVREAGNVVITITLGGLFASVLSTSLVILTSRVGFFIESFAAIFGASG